MREFSTQFCKEDGSIDWDKLKLRLEKGNNSTYWIKKISRNMERDAENEKSLRWQDWTVLRFWGQDIVKHTDECVKAVDEAVLDRRIGVDQDFGH